MNTYVKQFDFRTHSLAQINLQTYATRIPQQPGVEYNQHYHNNPALSITSITTATRTTQFESTGSDSICASLRVGALLLCCITQLQLQTQVGHSSHLSPRLTNQSTDICNPDTTTTRIPHSSKAQVGDSINIYIYSTTRLLLEIYLRKIELLNTSCEYLC